MADSGSLALAGPVRVLADDLTGAADSGVAFLCRGGNVLVSLRHGGFPVDASGVAVVDTDTREGSSAHAYVAVQRAALGLGPEDHLLKKIDSLLRGHIAAELAALRRSQPQRLVIVAPSVPALGRGVRGGALVPSGAEPRQVQAALGSGLARGIELDVIRSGPGGLGRALRSAAAVGATAVCDALTDDDLDAIVAAGLALGRPVLWVGAAGLAAALARALPVADRPADMRPAGGSVRAAAPLLIVGSHTAPARAQVSALTARGARWVGFDAVQLATMPAGQRARHAAALTARPPGVPTVVGVTGPVDHRASKTVAAALGQICAPAVASAELVVISGGATARAALVCAGVTDLALLGEVAPGTVLARTAGQGPSLHVITKSGSFGDPDTLLRLAAAAAPDWLDTGWLEPAPTPGGTR
jgi:4-hydroxythreonine-4-phosphate dehydrogenase